MQAEAKFGFAARITHHKRLARADKRRGRRWCFKRFRIEMERIWRPGRLKVESQSVFCPKRTAGFAKSVAHFETSRMDKRLCSRGKLQLAQVEAARSGGGQVYWRRFQD